MTPIRIGILGAARIAPAALVKPARDVEEVEVAAVAARDPERARAFAAKHGIGRVHGSYADLVADPDVDAIYNPLPNSLHAEWTLAALAAGKHVLCEKPFTANAAEAETVAIAAADTDLVVMEAFHYRYHPLATRMKAVVDSGELGAIQHIETWMCIPLAVRGDIRYRYDLAGGATMDVGAYAIHMLRFLAGDEPSVMEARAKLSSPNVDRWMRARMAFADGRTGRITCALFSSAVLRIAVHVKGSLGQMRVFNPVGPQFYHRLTVKAGGRRRVEHVERSATYLHQLRAFASAVGEGAPVLTPPADSVANMRVIDAVYDAAGLPRRGSQH